MGGGEDAIAKPGEERGLGLATMDKAKAGLGFFERYLSLWVALCIVVGIGLGTVMPGPFRLLGEANLAKVNLPVAVLIWLMIIPIPRALAGRAALAAARDRAVKRAGLE